MADGRLRQRPRVRRERRDALLPARRVVAVDEDRERIEAEVLRQREAEPPRPSRRGSTRARRRISWNATPNSAPLAAWSANPAARQPRPRVTSLPSNATSE
jgi:hypothetical protein